MNVIKAILNSILFCLASTFCIAQNEGNDLGNLGNSVEEGYLYYLTTATSQLVLGNANQAIAGYRECLKYKPQSAVVYYQLSKIYRSKGEILPAKNFAANAVKYDPSNKWYKIQLANLYRSLNMIDSATFMYERLLEDEPSNLEYKFIVTGLYEETERFNDALKLLEDIEKSYGITKEISLRKFRILNMEGKESDALEELKEAIMFFPEDYEIKGLLAEFYRDLNKPDSALLFYMDLLNEFKDEPFVLFSYAEFCMKQGLADSSRRIIIRAINNEDINLQEKQAYFYQLLQDENLFSLMMPLCDAISYAMIEKYPNDLNTISIYADIQFKIHNYDRSSDALKRLLKYDITNYIAWQQLLASENYLGRNDSIIKYAGRAKEIFSEQPLPYIYLAIAYHNEKGYDFAVATLLSGLPYATDRSIKIQFYSLLGECFNYLKLYDSSDKYFSEALKIEPDNMAINNNYAYYLAEREERLKEALKMSKMTIVNKNYNATYLDTYGWILFKMNRIRKAEKYIRMALQLDNNEDGEILDHLGDILYKKRKYPEAVVVWKKALYKDKEKDTILLMKIQKAEAEL